MVRNSRSLHLARAGIALAALCALVLAGCGQEAEDAPADSDATGQETSDDGAEQTGEVELRFTWWGSDLRHRLTQEVIDAFEAEHPGITIVPEFSDFTGYWDKLATTAAAGDLPDIIQMDEKYLLTYVEQGSLLDLSTLENLDTSEVDPDTLASGEVDGQLYALVSAVNALSMVTNKTLMDEAGVAVPDDSTWTWEEFSEVSAEITQATGQETWGMQGMGIADGDLNVWARQMGESQWTPEGGFGISEEVLTQWWQYVVSLKDEGAMPPPEIMEEARAGGQETSMVATNRAVFGLWWANQHAGLSESSGDELLLLMPPRQEAGGESGLYYKPSMFWSASATTEHPEEVGLFIDFLNNSPLAGEILLVERGVPSNLTVREEITPLLGEREQLYVAYIDQISDEIGPAAPVTPEGGATFEQDLQRYNLSVLFGQSSPQEAAAQFTQEVENKIS